MSYVDDVVKIALGEDGVREQGTNWGPKVRQYINAIGHDEPLYWCAAFVRWSMLKAAEQNGFYLKNWLVRPKLVCPEVPILADLNPQWFGSCSLLGGYAAHEGILYDRPRAGDLFLIPKDDGGYHHTGIVVSVSGVEFHTIEGNTNDEGSRNGYEVCRRVRSCGGRMRFVRWAEEMSLPKGVGEGFALLLNTTKLGEMPNVKGRSYFPVKDWARALGIPYRYDQEAQRAYLGIRSLESDLLNRNGVFLAPIRDLVRACGLVISAVDNAAHTVTVTRP